MPRSFKLKPSLIIFILQTLVILGLIGVLIRIMIPITSGESHRIVADGLNRGINKSTIRHFEREAYWRLQPPPSAEYLEKKIRQHLPVDRVFYEDIVIFDETTSSIPTEFPEYKVLHIWRNHQCTDIDDDLTGLEGREEHYDLDGTTAYKDIVTSKPGAQAWVYQELDYQYQALTFGLYKYVTCISHSYVEPKDKDNFVSPTQ